MARTAASPEQVEAVRRRTERLAHWLDSAFRIPGTRWRVGLDAIVGLIPGFGDLLGLLFGAWFLVEGARSGAPTSLLLRMAGNIAVDAAAGVVPVVGDLADAAFKSNQRNARLLSQHLQRLQQPAAARRRSPLGYLLAALMLTLIPLAFYGAWQLVARLLAA